MSRIIEIIGCSNKVNYALVAVLLDDGTEAEVWVGGSVEVYYDHGRIKAWVKRRLDKE